MTVLILRAMPVSRATRSPSITKKRKRLDAIVSRTACGSFAQTSSGPYGLLSRNVPDGRADPRTSR